MASGVDAVPSWHEHAAVCGPTAECCAEPASWYAEALHASTSGRGDSSGTEYEDAGDRDNSIVTVHPRGPVTGSGGPPPGMPPQLRASKERNALSACLPVVLRKSSSELVAKGTESRGARTGTPAASPKFAGPLAELKRLTRDEEDFAVTRNELFEGCSGHTSQSQDLAQRNVIAAGLTEAESRVERAIQESMGTDTPQRVQCMRVDQPSICAAELAAMLGREGADVDLCGATVSGTGPLDIRGARVCVRNGSLQISHGVYVHAGAVASMQGIKISRVKRSSAPQHRFGMHQLGASVTVAGRGTLLVMEDCSVSGCTPSGLHSTDGACVKAVNCAFSGSRESGVGVSRDGAVSLEGCTVADNQRNNVFVTAGSHAALAGCVVKGSTRLNGVTVKGDGATACLSDTSASGNEISNVRADDGGAIEMRGCSVSSCGFNGLSSAGAGSYLYALDCRVRASGTHNALSWNLGHMILEDCEVLASRRTGAMAGLHARMELIGCNVGGNVRDYQHSVNGRIAVNGDDLSTGSNLVVNPTAEAD